MTDGDHDFHHNKNDDDYDEDGARRRLNKLAAIAQHARDLTFLTGAHPLFCNRAPFFVMKIECASNRMEQGSMPRMV